MPWARFSSKRLRTGDRRAAGLARRDGVDTLLPEHIEKIVTTFEEYREVPGFSAIVDIETLKENDWNLNIPRYVEPVLGEETLTVSEAVKGLKQALDEDRFMLYQQCIVALKEELFFLDQQ